MKWISTTNTSLIIIDICSRMLHTLEFVKLKGYGYTGHWSAVTRRASAVGTCSKVADSVTEFQCRVEKAIQPLNQSLTSHLSSSSHNAKLVCVCVLVWMQKPDGSMGKRIRTGSAEAIIKSISMCLVQGTRILIQNS